MIYIARERRDSNDYNPIYLFTKGKPVPMIWADDDGIVCRMWRYDGRQGVLIAKKNDIYDNITFEDGPVELIPNI